MRSAPASGILSSPWNIWGSGKEIKVHLMSKRRSLDNNPRDETGGRRRRRPSSPRLRSLSTHTNPQRCSPPAWTNSLAYFQPSECSWALIATIYPSKLRKKLTVEILSTSP